MRSIVIGIPGKIAEAMVKLQPKGTQVLGRKP